MLCNEIKHPIIKKKKLFTNKGEIISCKSVKPCKNRKNSQAYFVRTRDKSGSKSPPFHRNVQIPPSPGTMHSQMPGVCPGGGDVEVSNWSAHNEINAPEAMFRRRMQERLPSSWHGWKYIDARKNKYTVWYDNAWG